jgi:hypothetical protein
MAAVGLSFPPTKSKMLIRSIDMNSWRLGVELFDGKNPVKVAKHQANPAMIWLFTVEKWAGQVACVTWLNGQVVNREFYTSDERMVS